MTYEGLNHIKFEGGIRYIYIGYGGLDPKKSLLVGGDFVTACNKRLIILCI